MLAEALERAAHERGAYLDESCADPLLRREVESLLAAHDGERPTLVGPAAAGEREPRQAGSKIGPYEIVARIGAGGMGVVYKARDPKLGRLLAVKLLPEGALADALARARFLREAQNASSLNHPNIATIYEIGEDAGETYIAMEFVEGRPLSAVIDREGLALETALRYALEISAGLAHAHERGIVHRDLKPANVVVTADGHVKILDFGLAKKLLLAELSEATLPANALTKAGAIVGTLQYMAPETLRGESADARTDIWALGAVLSEMLAGTPPFHGRTAYELSSAILREMPAPLPPHVPLSLQSVTQRCLAKEREQRYQRASEVRAALEAIQTHTADIAAPVFHPPQRPKSSAKALRYVSIAGGVLLLAAIAAVAIFYPRRQPPAVRYEQLTNFSDSVSSPALSPDGRMLAFLHGESTFDGPADVWIKLLPDGAPVQLTHDGSTKMGVEFSPDGSRIAYTHLAQWNWDTWAVPSLGGTPSLLLPDASGLTWIGDRQVMFSEITTGLYMKIVTSDENRGGQRDVYLPPDREIGMAHRSYLSPDRKWVLVVEMDNRGWLPCRLTPFSGGSQGRVVGPAPSRCTSAAWSPDGKWMYFSADAGSGFHLWREKFPDGVPQQITSGTSQEEGIAVAPDGKSLVTAVGTEQSSIFLHDSQGLRQITSQGYAYSPSISPDGKQIYYLLRTNSARAFVAGELHSVDLATGRDDNSLPGFSISRYDISRDGQRIVFAALDQKTGSTIWLASLSHSFPPRQLTKTESYRPYLAPGGEIFYLNRDGNRDYVYRMKDDGAAQERVIPDPVIYLLGVSPDGREIVVWVGQTGSNSPNAVIVYPSDGGRPFPLCTRCGATGPAYTGSAIVNWSLDQKYF
ncbi:MAG TPA: protein kinase, partial [Rhizomicrobium sp.]|nr:protein kinase [Rhizomicrobium sp.]